MNPKILGGHSRWLSPLLHSSIWETLMTAWSLHSISSLPSTGFLRSYSDLCYFLQITWSRNQTSSVSLWKTLVVQVDPWLNQPWSSLALTKFFLWKTSNVISLWNWNLSTHVGVQSIFFREIKYFYAWKLSTSPSLSSIWCDRSLWNENLKWK